MAKEEQITQASIEAEARKAHIPKPEYDPAYDFTSDAPIKSHTDDRLNRTHFAQRIAETLMRRPAEESIVVGIYGKWGSGKSSVLNMMQEKIQDFGDAIIVINFNPWYFSSKEAIIRGFFAELYTKLGDITPKIKKHISKISGIFAPFSVRLKAPFIGGPQLHVDGKKLEEAIKNFTNTSLEDEKKEIEKILCEQEKRIIIFIDDIDRLDKEETHILFKLVKLFADFPYTAYVLTFDDVVVAKAIGERYGNDKIDGFKFLEKIVQVPLHMPAPNTETLQGILFGKIDKILLNHGIIISDDDAKFTKITFLDDLAPYFNSLRIINSYLNNLNFILAILKDEVNIGDLLILEGIRSVFPEIYIQLYGSLKHLFNEYNFYFVGEDKQKAEREKIINKIFNNVKDNDKKALESIFENILPILYHTPYRKRDPEKVKHKRLCTDLYFHKYFQYAVPEQLTSDVVLTLYSKRLSSDDKSERYECMEDIHTNEKFKHVLRHLRVNIDNFDSSELKNIARAISENVHLIPYDYGFFIENPYDNAFFLIYLILSKVEKNFEFAKSLILSTKYLPFSLRWIYLNKDDDIFTTDEILILKNEVLRLTKDANKQEQLYLTFEIHAGWLYHLWNNMEPQNEIKQSIMQSLKETPLNLYLLLISFCQQVARSPGGVSLEFTMESYKSIIIFLDTDCIPDILEQGFQIDLNDAVNEEAPSKTPEELRIVNQFAYWHKRALDEQVEANKHAVDESPQPDTQE